MLKKQITIYFNYSTPPTTTRNVQWSSGIYFALPDIKSLQSTPLHTHTYKHMVFQPTEDNQQKLYLLLLLFLGERLDNCGMQQNLKSHSNAMKKK